MHSCIYRGHVSHRRVTPAHRFRVATSWIYLDLDEVDHIIGTLWCIRNDRFAPLSFRRADHFGDPQQRLKESVTQHVEDTCGLRLTGPVRLLTQLRHFGFYFSPINVFYCFDDHERLIALVAEVNNTPWNERHVYVLWEGNSLPGSAGRYTHPKEFHVSPFMDMQSEYDWSVRLPQDTLQLSLACRKQAKQVFHASLDLSRRDLTDGQLLLSLSRRPVAAAHILGSIYFQALRLWMKKCQFHPHPRRGQKPRLIHSAGSTQSDERGPLKPDSPQSR